MSEWDEFWNLVALEMHWMKPFLWMVSRYEMVDGGWG